MFNRILKFCGVSLLALITCIIAYPFVLRLLGYYVDVTGSEMAQIAFEKNNVDLCKKIQLVWRVYPPAVERRMECVYTYASLAHDPSACELLMPSSYGLACAGKAAGPPICGINPGFEVQWHEGDAIQYSSLQDCQKDNGRSKRGDQCCFIATVSGIRNFNDCSSLKNDAPVYDNCLNQLAFKNHDPDSCAAIQDKITKSECLVSATALKKDPTICSNCSAPFENIQGLKK